MSCIISYSLDSLLIQCAGCFHFHTAWNPTVKGTPRTVQILYSALGARVVPCLSLPKLNVTHTMGDTDHAIDCRQGGQQTGSIGHLRVKSCQMRVGSGG
jgi:hypothetical protein